MSITFALDVYGTLIDPLQIGEQLTEHVGDRAQDLAELWRNKQLEYSFRRGLMGEYKTFPEVTREALEFALQAFDVALSADVKSALMAKYRALAAFDDVAPALSVPKTNGAQLHAFSNGLADDVAALLERAKIDHLILSTISVDDVKTFKPDPRVYAHFNDVTGSSPDETWLVSSNPFDIIGASAFGWSTAWVKRKPSAVFDPWEHQPTKIITSLEELVSMSANTP